MLAATICFWMGRKNMAWSFAERKHGTEHVTRIALAYTAKIEALISQFRFCSTRWTRLGNPSRKAGIGASSAPAQGVWEPTFLDGNLGFRNAFLPCLGVSTRPQSRTLAPREETTARRSLKSHAKPA
jgi:hypothetical protein